MGPTWPSSGTCGHGPAIIHGQWAFISTQPPNSSSPHTSTPSGVLVNYLRRRRRLPWPPCSTPSPPPAPPPSRDKSGGPCFLRDWPAVGLGCALTTASASSLSRRLLLLRPAGPAATAAAAFYARWRTLRLKVRFALDSEKVRSFAMIEVGCWRSWPGDYDCLVGKLVSKCLSDFVFASKFTSCNRRCGNFACVCSVAIVWWGNWICQLLDKLEKMGGDVQLFVNLWFGLLSFWVSRLLCGCSISMCCIPLLVSLICHYIFFLVMKIRVNCWKYVLVIYICCADQLL